VTERFEPLRAHEGDGLLRLDRIGRATVAPPPAAASAEPRSGDADSAGGEPSPDAGVTASPSAAAPLPSPDGGPPPAAPVPPPAALRSDDAETPRVSVRPPTPTPTPTPTVQPFQPRIDFGVEMGLVQGGEELAVASSTGGMTETLGAGDGLLLAFKARLTPWWIADSVGLGIGGGAGIKYWSVGGDGAEASMREYVLMATGHALFAATPIWLFVLQGGVEKDHGIDFSINGSSSGIPFESRMGFVADIGGQRALDDHWSFAFSLRVTRLDYAVEGRAVGANSVGLTLAFHCRL